MQHGKVKVDGNGSMTGKCDTGGSAAHARSPRRGRRRSSEQQRTQQHAVSAAEHTAAEEYVAAPSPKSSPAKASEVSPFPATGVPPVSTGAVPGVPPLLPLPAGRPPLPPAELLRAQVCERGAAQHHAVFRPPSGRHFGSRADVCASGCECSRSPATSYLNGMVNVHLGRCFDRPEDVTGGLIACQLGVCEGVK